jgi:hypothetical protein
LPVLIVYSFVRSKQACGSWWFLSVERREYAKTLPGLVCLLPITKKNRGKQFCGDRLFLGPSEGCFYLLYATVQGEARRLTHVKKDWWDAKQERGVHLACF